MGRERQAAQAGHGRRSQSEGAASPALARLAGRFALFRSQHPRGTRYPDELRQAALALLGEAPDALYRTCGVSFRQVMAWKACRSAAARAVDSEPPKKVRVFSVVDEESVACAEMPAAVWVAEPGVELRLGPWTVSVRLAGRPSAERGRACCP